MDFPSFSKLEIFAIFSVCLTDVQSFITLELWSIFLRPIVPLFSAGSFSGTGFPMGDVLFWNLPESKEFMDVHVYNTAVSGLLGCAR